jgi:hypothetical protein
MGWNFTDEKWKEFRKTCYDPRVVDGHTSQIAFMALGKKASSDAKNTFDLKGGRGLREERYMPNIKHKLRAEKIDLAAKVSGKSSIDLTLPGIDKGFGFAAISAVLGCGLRDMIFFGPVITRRR